MRFLALREKNNIPCFVWNDWGEGCLFSFYSFIFDVIKKTSKKKLSL